MTSHTMIFNPSHDTRLPINNKSDLKQPKRSANSMIFNPPHDMRLSTNTNLIKNNPKDWTNIMIATS